MAWHVMSEEVIAGKHSRRKLGMGKISTLGRLDWRSCPGRLHPVNALGECDALPTDEPLLLDMSRWASLLQSA